MLAKRTALASEISRLLALGGKNLVYNCNSAGINEESARSQCDDQHRMFGNERNGNGQLLNQLFALPGRIRRRSFRCR